MNLLKDFYLVKNKKIGFQYKYIHFDNEFENIDIKLNFINKIYKHIMNTL